MTTEQKTSNLLRELSEAAGECERAATALSEILKGFDLNCIPFCSQDLNNGDVGSKILTAKFLLSVGNMFADDVCKEGETA